MPRVLSSVLLTLGLLISLVPLAQADPRSDALLEKLGMTEMVSIMRQEGLEYADNLAADMLSRGESSQWKQNIDRIYDEKAMRQLVQGGFAKALDGIDLTEIERFFSTDLATRAVQLEISARRAMLDEDIEEAAKDTAKSLEKDADPRHALVARFIEQGEMVEANVVSALNSNIGFYQGLVDGNAFKMSEAEIVADVWSQEAETRTETKEWLFGFFLLAYAPLSLDELEQFVTFSNTKDGRILTRAIFSAYDLMYADISYALGRAVAQDMQAQEL